VGVGVGGVEARGTCARRAVMTRRRNDGVGFLIKPQRRRISATYARAGARARRNSGPGMEVG